MRRDHVDAFGDLEPRRIGIDNERADAARARRLAGSSRTPRRSRRCRRWRSRSCRRRARKRRRLRAADSAMAATSEPASGSDSANAAMAVPFGDARQIALLLLVACRRARSRRSRAPASRARSPRGPVLARAFHAAGRRRACRWCRRGRRMRCRPRHISASLPRRVRARDGGRSRRRPSCLRARDVAPHQASMPAASSR